MSSRTSPASLRVLSIALAVVLVSSTICCRVDTDRVIASASSVYFFPLFATVFGSPSSSSHCLSLIARLLLRCRVFEGLGESRVDLAEGLGDRRDDPRELLDVLEHLAALDLPLV